ncbi:M28 family peptidase [Consotaella salsifontis]|uniref:PA domain-containing protein n=1 Tax=Consotaella salsifontis TaxID=1365950 RepID=A0A1T4SD48_9HYPH|nr:M28 family peptidase [Consotaella salsifontis]SKA26230.1 PA domain-containing protein [Consotaella salsifontis]
MSEPSPLDGKLGGRVDAARLMEHIAEFAKRVKLSGTPEELESFAYLKERMESYGFTTTLILHDAYISLPGATETVVDGRPLDCITHSMAVATGAEGITADLVYVGEGTAEDFARADVAGKIALIDGIAVEDVADRASRAGAIGEIHISPNEHLYEMCVSPVWGSPSQHTLADLPTTAIVTVRNDDGAKLRERCRAGERVTAHLKTEVDTGWRKTPILVCDLDIAGPDAPFVLFCGHHDTWHYGVMDNGGANATMLEAARILAESRDTLRRNLRVCFWSGHSHGRYSGSAWYADEYFDELDRRCAAHVNVDSTGGEGAIVLTNSGVIDELKHLAAEVIDAETGQHHAGRRHGRAADQSFWGVGIPSMFGSLSHQPPGPVKMLTALGWWWHTPHDLAEHIDPENLQRDTRIVLEVLRRLLSDRVLPLDYGAWCEALGRLLDEIEPAVGDRLDLSGVVQSFDALCETVEAFADYAANAEASEAPALDAALMRASRALVPLDYTFGDRFVHDSAVPHPAWPALADLFALARLAKGAPEEKFHIVSARRARNRLIHALREAEQALTLT